MSFQLILTAVPTCGTSAGDFDVEFRFARCEWTTGDASGGSGGFGGTPAQAGFDAGNLLDFVEIPGSRTGSIHTIMCSNSNVGEPGIWRFQIRGGTVMCPDAGAPCDTGEYGICATGRTNCVRDEVICIPDVSPTRERCDALDNDCDGETDEGDDVCPVYQVCDRGVCRQLCSEFGCPPRQVCAADGRCIDEGCEGVECDPGERCRLGECVGACEGIVCPVGRTCRSGRCIDPCSEMTCDECTVCVDGVCAFRCDRWPCPAGEVCLPDGRCLAETCRDVGCLPGEYCLDGACLDACDGAVCPDGEHCELGECLPGDPPGPDADADTDAETDVGTDADADADADAEVEDVPDVPIDFGHDAYRPPADDPLLGCDCRAPGARPVAAGPAAVLALLVGLVALRRRRR
jgi:hypothetical protein